MPLGKNLKRLMIAAAAAAVLVVGGLAGYRALDAHISDYDLVLTPSQISADGVSSSLLEIRLISRFGNRLNVRALPSMPIVEIVEGADLVNMIALGDSLSYRLVARYETGTVRIQARIPGTPGPIEAKLELTASLADRNENGYPDQLDLSSESDRSSFRRWFTAIALGQMTHLDDRWNDRDCAGLLRYCYREALKKHDNRWLAGRKWLVDPSIPDVRKYNYPHVPLVGTRVFNAGSRPEDRTTREASDQGTNRGAAAMIGNFVEFAEAARLKDNSLRFLGRSPESALPGDVIFYLNDTDSEWPYHTMIYLGGGRTIYHTGPDSDKPGIVKRMDLEDLAMHPNPRWHPVASNPYFLGFYRWRILG
jgi:uncharacterized protein